MEIAKSEDQGAAGRQLRKRPSSTAKVEKTPGVKIKPSQSKHIVAQPDNTIIEIIDPLRKEESTPDKLEQKPPVIEVKVPLSRSVKKSNKGRKKKSPGLPISTVDDIKAEPTRWLKLPLDEMKNLIKDLWAEGPYPCFAITSKNCGTFRTVDEAVKHNKRCIKPMYMTYTGERLPLFRALPKAVRQRYVREALAANNEITCHTCGKVSVHVFGMVYHLERCGVELDKQPWKCWRCGLEATAEESKSHLRKCTQTPGLPEEDVELEEESGDEPEEGGEEYVPEEAVDDVIVDEPLMRLPKADIDSPEKKPLIINSNYQIKRRRSGTASVSAGILPAESSRVRVANTGQPRYKFRRTEILKLVADMGGWEQYKEKVEQSANQWIEEHRQSLPASLSANTDTSATNIGPAVRPSKSSVGFHFRDNTLAYVSSDKLPDDLNFLNVYESTSKEADECAPGNWVTIGYSGAPIHTMKFAPNLLSEDEEVLMTVNYDNDDTLLAENWKDSRGIVDFWIIKHGEELEKASTIRPWFTLESNYGAIISACWLDVPRLQTEESLIGFIALSTGQGVILIYRIDINSAPSAADKLLLVSAEPLLILRQDSPVSENDEDIQEIKYSPPITRIEWSAFENSRYIAGISAVGSVLVWDLEGDLNCPNALFSNQWASPACDLCFCKDYELVVSFREKCVRVYDFRTWALLLEENTVRTAGTRVTSCQRALSGFVTFQSEYFNNAMNGLPNTGIHYVCSDDVSRGYFVVPLANRHDLQMWDASIHSTTAIIATCGVDGQLRLSGNGRVVPRLSKIDTHFSVIRESMLLSNRRIEDLNSNGDAKLLESLFTHESVCEKTWLEISLKPTKADRNVPYSSLALRTESLNVVATNNYSKKPIVVTGGQAGLLFIRPCRLDLGGNTIDPLDLISSLTTSAKSRKQTEPIRRQPVRKEKKPPIEAGSNIKEEKPKMKKVVKKEPKSPAVRKERPSRIKKDK